MKDYQSLNHTKWDCKYHVVFIPKRRRKQIYGAIRKYLGEIFHELARQKESKIIEGHLCADHVHMCVSIRPEFAVSSVVGYLKGRVRSQLQEILQREKGILPEKVFGLVPVASNEDGTNLWKR